MVKIFITISFQLFFLSVLWSQNAITISLLRDQDDISARGTEQAILHELEALLSARFLPTFDTILIDSQNPEQQLSSIYQGNTDLVIAVGFQVSNFLASRGVYEKPTILTLLLDNELQGVPFPVDGKSGIKNLCYIQSPFNIQRDFEILYDIKPYQKLAILVDASTQRTDFDFNAFIDKQIAFSGATYEVYLLDKVPETILDPLPDDIDAAFLFPVFSPEKENLVKQTLSGLTQRGIPTFGLLSEPSLKLGVYAAYDTEDNFARIPRRVALNASKILEGQTAESLPVFMDNYTENLIINMQTAQATRHYPSWEIMAEAILINVSLIENAERQLTMQSAVAEGLNNSLGIRIAEKDVSISVEDLKIARSNYLPQIDATATALALDEATVSRSFGTQGRYNLQASATLTQLLLSEPALANVAIQRLLLRSQEEVLRQSQLDIVQDVAAAYLNILQATALVRLRNENVAVTRKNYDIALAKEQVGFSGTSDVYRFESELALNNVDLNTAQAQWRQARFQLNNILNRPIKEEFQLADAAVSDSILLVTDPRLFALINNPGDVEIFADFLVQEASNNLPELQQLELALAAQERSLLSQKRAFYLPTVALSAEYTVPIDQYSFPETVMPLELTNTWNAAVAVQFPIFQGNSRRYQKQQTEVGVFQLQDQMANLRNNLELQVRANMETAGASFSNLALSNQAVEASRKNFEIAQNSYQQGLLNITSLIDAQNALLQAEINAINAEYTFINDFLSVERAIGYFHFLAPPQDQDAFFQRFVQFITNID